MCLLYGQPAVILDVIFWNNHYYYYYFIFPELHHSKKEEEESIYTKPKMSYAQLIAEALLTGQDRMLTLNEIYIAVNKQHPYYSLDAATGRNWQNAIRSVLSVFSCISIKNYVVSRDKNNQDSPIKFRQFLVENSFIFEFFKGKGLSLTVATIILYI